MLAVDSLKQSFKTAVHKYKMERFTYKGGCGICGRTCIKTFKRRAGFGLLVIQNSYATKKLKNKAVSSFNNVVSVSMWSLVPYSNCFIIYYRLMQHGSTNKACLCLVLFNTVLLHYK